MYPISKYTYDRAKQFGLDVFPSTHRGKKIDVYKDGEFIHSIGAIGYKDYPTYIKEEGIEYANERRRLYHLRHTGDSIGEILSKLLLW
jgi:hypothetical protein